MPVDGIFFLCTNWTQFINGFSEEVEDSPEGFFSHWHGDGFFRVQSFHTTSPWFTESDAACEVGSCGEKGTECPGLIAKTPV